MLVYCYHTISAQLLCANGITRTLSVFSLDLP